MSLNRVVMQGRLVADPELRHTQSGVAVTTMRVAVDRNYKNADGEKESDFFTCTAWRGTAEFAEKFFHKGEQILVEGKLQNNQYTDKDGNNRISTQIMVDSVFFCGDRASRSRRGDSDRDNGHSEQSAYESGPSFSGVFKDLDDDGGAGLPF